MLLTPIQISAALDSLTEQLSKADLAFDRWLHTDDEWAKGNAEWYLSLAFAQLLTLAEVLGLPLLRRDVAKVFQAATKHGLLRADTDPDGDAHQKWGQPIRRWVAVLKSTFTHELGQTITKDLESILRAATYSITDARVFGAPPRDEADVHRRLECILKCVFPDLRSKPHLTKSIKHFEPDTGLPSIQTLIEYKFVATEEQIPLVADQLLADTRGYTSRDWTSFMYVIYEAKRLRAESEWQRLFRECGVPDTNVSVVVISGEPVPVAGSTKSPLRSSQSRQRWRRRR